MLEAYCSVPAAGHSEVNWSIAEAACCWGGLSMLLALPMRVGVAMKVAVYMSIYIFGRGAISNGDIRGSTGTWARMSRAYEGVDGLRISN